MVWKFVPAIHQGSEQVCLCVLHWPAYLSTQLLPAAQRLQTSHLPVCYQPILLVARHERLKHSERLGLPP